MLGLIVCSLFCLASSQAASPLAHRHPGIAIAKQWKSQMQWQEKYLTKNLTTALEKIEGFLLSVPTDEIETNNASTECVKSIMHFGYDFSKGKRYTLIADDSDGKPESGIFLGNIQWIGRYDECMKIRNENFKGKWCSIDIGNRSKVLSDGNTLGLSLGICVPESCSSDYLDERLEGVASQSGVKFRASCPVQPSKWTGLDVASLFVFCLVALLVIVGTIVERLTTDKDFDGESGMGIVGDGIYFARQAERSTVVKVLSAFSITKNTDSLLSTEWKQDSIEALHGIRFMSIAWVILGHTFVIPLLYIKNFMDVTEWYTGKLSSQMVANAVFAVDSFFFISGLLVVYTGLKEAEKREGKLQVWKMYLTRYIRITPPYAMLLFILVGFYGKFGDGPMWPDALAGERNPCQKYWWTNLLYINNLYPATITEQCFPIGWYLANDMQFFLLAPISILLLQWRPKVGLNLLAFGIFFSVLVTGILSSHFNELPQAVSIALIIKELSSFTNTTSDNVNALVPPVTNDETFWNDLYTKPWCRISAYLVGMITGYILHTTRGNIKMPKVAIMFGWLIFGALISIIVFGLWPYVSTDVQMTVSLGAFYNSMSRVMWAIALAWLVIVCISGSGGPVNRFLSWNLFKPLSRLSYCIYLVHSPILLWQHATKEVPGNYSAKDLAFDFVGTLAISTFVAYIFSMMFEAPIIGLMKIILPRAQEPESELSGTPLIMEDDGGNSGLADASGEGTLEFPQRQDDEDEELLDAA